MAKAEPVARAKAAVRLQTSTIAAPDEAWSGSRSRRPCERRGGRRRRRSRTSKEYLIIFAVLTVLTVLEGRALTQIPGIPKHLLAPRPRRPRADQGRHRRALLHAPQAETRVLKLTVALPLAAPTIYAVVLMTEAAWRLTR